MKKLNREFYFREDVVEISRNLLGKIIYTHINHHLCGGMITETEAYAGITDKASHAYKGRRTKRTEIMYSPGGISYVYLCYGIHHLFNILTNVEEIPHAVLIRGIQPLEGITEMLKRRKQNKLLKNTCIGPGKVSQALGIDLQYNGVDLHGEEIWIEDHGISFSENQIKSGKRIGVEYAKEDALLPYRFWVH
ncbi:MAG: DNA-3-methyladenine glycosylase [Bacteroidetes bacterium]|nr:DNA-3-methyladenine glycosylase [Bacteroidota bacterium]